MRHFIGIDLGTTNSAICSFDGRETVIWKSPEQSDVTPSAIYIDRRGHYFYGRKAFEMAAEKEENSATLFKRYLGTTKTYRFQDADVSLTPVECSAQLLRVLYSYLPEDVRNDPETVTVITVPAAFNQMKKDATLEAARLAGIGRTALMQEPVAAVMSVLKKDDREKTFLIYDLGGGTFDISVARLVGGHVSLLAQGGREMCGGRDMDRWIYNHKILPWLKEHFTLSDDPDREQKYLDMKRSILFAAEEAKIALTSGQEASIWMDEDQLHTTDECGKEMFVEMTLTREDLTGIITEMAEDTVLLTFEAMQRAGVSAGQVDQIVFVGGPTMYAPLREAVCERLGIERGTPVNPMTAVAEGASIYAETINWEDSQHARKESIEEMSGGITENSFGKLSGEKAEKDSVKNPGDETGNDFRKMSEDGSGKLSGKTFGDGTGNASSSGLPEDKKITVRYEKRTSMSVCKIAVIAQDAEMKVVRIRSANEAESVYDSGRLSIVRQGIIQVPLPEIGIYHFMLRIEDSQGNLCMPEEQIEVTRTLASLQSIPASHSIAVKALDRPGGVPIAVYLVEVNDPLPKSGTVVFRAADQLVGGSDGALTFSLWEGEIREPVDDNRYIGTYRIPGKAISGGVITVGMEIICNYEMNEAGNLRLGVEVPGVGVRLAQQNFYSRIEGQIDLQDTYSLVKEVNELLERTSQMQQRIVDSKLTEVRAELLKLRNVLSHSTDPETIAQAESDLMDMYRQVAILHQRYASVMKTQELDRVIREFDRLKKGASEDEIAAFQNLVELARYSIDMGSSDFDSQLKEMNRRVGELRWRDDSYIRMLFFAMVGSPGDYTDRARFDHLKAEGLTCLENKDMDSLRNIINEIYSLRKDKDRVQAERMFDDVGVYLG